MTFPQQFSGDTLPDYGGDGKNYSSTLFNDGNWLNSNILWCCNRYSRTSSAFFGSALSGTIKKPQNVTNSGKYVIGLIQSFASTGFN